MKLRLLSVLALVVFSGCTAKKSHVQELTINQKRHLKAMAQVGLFYGPEDVVPDQIPSKEERCAERIKGLPADYTYGWLSVPENPEDEQGRQISVFYYGRVKQDPSLKQDITVFYNGGPGSDSEGSYYVLADLQSQDTEKNKVNFLFIDQRGNGCSDPYPQGDSEESIQRLTYYGSRGIVADSEKIRQHLIGEQKWRVFGQSYGGYIVHKYAIIAPNSVNKAYAHANAITSNGLLRHAERVASQDRVLKEYFKVYPNDEAKFRTLDQYLFNKPCVTDSRDKKYCGYQLSSSFLMLLGFSDAWPRVNKWINKIVDDNGVVNFEHLQKLAEYYLFEEEPSWNQQYTVQAVIAYADRNYSDFEGKLCEKANNVLRERGLEPEKFLLSECKDETSIYADGSTGQIDSFDYTKLKGLKTDWMTADQLKLSLQAHSDLQFFLYSGELDSFVPMANFKEQLDILGPLANLNYTHFMTTGHDGFCSEAQVWQDLLK